VRDEGQDIWVWDLERKTSTRLTVSPRPDNGPTWSPDGRNIFYASQTTTGTWEVNARSADGSGDPQTISEQQKLLQPQAVTADGARLLAIRGATNAPPFEVVLLDLAGRADLEVLLEGDASFGNPELSPNGRFLAYSSDESGLNEVYVRPFPELQARRWQISSGGGSRPLWSRDGREIFFLDGSGSFTAVPVTAREGELLIGRSEVLFKMAYYSTLGGRPYDVSLDGKRFLMIKAVQAETEPGNRIVYVQNWFDELRGRAPARR
jgi:Tol biopolymer transport system component